MRPKRIVAVDIDADAATLTHENVALNTFTNIEVHHADIRTFHSKRTEDPKDRQLLPFSNFADVLICNPPYFSNGRKSTNAAVRTARHDETLTLSELFTAATRLLKYGADLYFCYPARFVARAIATLNTHAFCVKRLTFIKNQKEIYLALIHAKKSNNDGCVVEVISQT